MRNFHRFAFFTAACAWLLVMAGAMVTSTGSGLAVPDWPLSYGTLFPQMRGGILYEHGHRLIAGFVATLTIIMAFWAYARVQDRTLRTLTYLALLAVFLQATLGGLTVMFKLPPAISTAHACLGQSYFSLLTVITLISSPMWQKIPRNTVTKTMLPHLTLCFLALAFCQLFIGAWMRHIGAGLAIPDFPTSFGGWLPPVFTYWIKVHFAHRIGALIISIYLIFFLAYGYSVHRQSRLVRFFLPVVLVLILTQIALGASIIWTGRHIVITSLHVLCGASILATLSMMTVVMFKHFDARQSYFLLTDYISLGKPRITLMVCLTCLVGYYLGSPAGMDVAKLIWTLWSVFLVSFGACSMNQVLEVQSDQAMARTRNRPIPAGRLTKWQGVGISFATTMVGLAVMYFRVGILPFVFLSISLVGYVLFYTPLKKVSHFNTLVGAIPGALPPVIGWVAASNRFSFEAFLLFLIMFLWQLPHFLAIAWMFADDYKKASMRMLPLMEGVGEVATRRQAFLYAVALLPAGLFPSFVGISGKIYFVGSFLVCLWFVFLVYQFFLRPDPSSARKVLMGSFVYLLILFSLMIIDRV